MFVECLGIFKPEIENSFAFKMTCYVGLNCAYLSALYLVPLSNEEVVF